MATTAWDLHRTVTAVKVVGLGYEPREWQGIVHRSRRRFNVLALHRRAGKTLLAVMELVTEAMACQRPQGVYVYVAPFLKQAKAIAWSVLKRVVEPLTIHGGAIIHEGDLAVTFPGNGAKIALYGADNPDAMRGMGLEGAVIDEVAQVQPYVWSEILQPALSDRLGWALFIGTPHGINLFSDLYFGSADKPDWYRGRWTVYETGALLPDEIARLKDNMSPQAFAREYLCDFAAVSPDQLMSLSDVELAAQRVYKEDVVKGAPIIIGVDPARFGDDRTVIMRRQGLVAFEPVILHGIDNMTVAATVAAHWEQYKPDAVFIDAGLGAGVIDRLRQLGYSPIEVPFGGTATAPTRYKDRRTEMWCTMRDWVRDGGKIPNILALKQEMATPTYELDHVGRAVLEPKDKTKKRLMDAGSPDIADALALTFAHPVYRRSEIEQVAHEQRVRRGEGRSDYDPFTAERLGR